MSIFRFRARSAIRERETDQSRFHWLLGALDELAGEMDAEARSLEMRYQRTATDAAFALVASESDDDSSLVAESDLLNTSMRAYTARLRALRRQRDFLDTLCDDIRNFLEDEAIEGRSRLRG